MAIVSNLFNFQAGSDKAAYGTINFSGSYTTGGESIDATQFGFSQIDSLTLVNKNGFLFNCVPSADLQEVNIIVYGGGIIPIQTQFTYGLGSLPESYGRIYYNPTSVSPIEVGETLNFSGPGTADVVSFGTNFNDIAYMNVNNVTGTIAITDTFTGATSGATGEVLSEGVYNVFNVAGTIQPSYLIGVAGATETDLLIEARANLALAGATEANWDPKLGTVDTLPSASYTLLKYGGITSLTSGSAFAQVINGYDLNVAAGAINFIAFGK